MNAQDAIIEAFCQIRLNLPPNDGYHSLGDVAYRAALIMGENYRQNLIEIRQAFFDSVTCREKSLPFHFSTSLARPFYFYACGRRRWPGTKYYLKDGLNIGRQNVKYLKWLS